MKLMKCNSCKFEREVQNKVIISICPYCQIEMYEVKDGKRRN